MTGQRFGNIGPLKTSSFEIVCKLALASTLSRFMQRKNSNRQIASWLTAHHSNSNLILVSAR